MKAVRYLAAGFAGAIVLFVALVLGLIYVEHHETRYCRAAFDDGGMGLCHAWLQRCQREGRCDSATYASYWRPLAAAWQREIDRLYSSH